MFVTADL